MLQAPRSGYYRWLHKPLSDRALEDQRLLGLIRASYTASGGVYGSPRIFLDLREVGEICGRNRVARIMRKNGKLIGVNWNINSVIGTTSTTCPVTRPGSSSSTVSTKRRGHWAMYLPSRLGESAAGRSVLNPSMEISSTILVSSSNTKTASASMLFAGTSPDASARQVILCWVPKARHLCPVVAASSGPIHGRLLDNAR